VRRAGDLRLLGKMIREANSEAKMISKIERPEAIENLEEIIEESYGVMVARGDMGVELGQSWSRRCRSGSSSSRLLPASR
jgi:pyruvate kinase